MSYLELYKKRMSGSNTSVHEQRTTISQNQAHRNFTLAQGYFPATLKEYGKREEPVDVIVRSGTSELQKYLLFRPESDVDTGAYILYNKKTYIVKEVNKDAILPKADCYLCNRELNFKDIDYPMPCYTNSTTYGSKGIVDQGKFYELDSKTKIYIQLNDITKRLRIGQRVMFANRYVYKITEIDDLVFPNMLTLVAERDETMPMDDFANNIAWNAYETPDKPEETSEIMGSEKIKLNASGIYTCTTEVTWSIDEPTIATIVNQTETEVELRGIKRGWVTLTATSKSGQTQELDIMVC